MFKFFKEKKEKKAREKHTYDLEIDNLAVAEMHTHKPETAKTASSDEEQPSVSCGTVAIPEIHIPKKKS